MYYSVTYSIVCVCWAMWFVLVGVLIWLLKKVKTPRDRINFETSILLFIVITYLLCPTLIFFVFDLPPETNYAPH